MQIYKYMDIGTAKPTQEEMQGIQHYLLDFVEPNQRYSVAEFKKDAENAIEQILAKGTVTTSSGATSFFSGPAQGKFSGSKATIENKLKACFSAMDNMVSGGNEHYAQEMASAIDSYLKAGSISVNLKAPFVSGTGGGSIA